MSLRVWLPFDGDLENQADLDLEYIAEGFNYDNNGKIGRCILDSGRIMYSGNDEYSLREIINSTKYSICYWVRFTKDITEYQRNNKWNFNIGDGENACRGFWITGSPDIFFWGYGGTNDLIYISKNLYDNKWHHIAIISNGSNLKIYIDGTYQNEINNARTSAVDTSNLYIYTNDAAINDFRIYDNILSTKEIKELSKALIAHYRLDNDGCGNDNLLAGNFSCVSTRSKYTQIGSCYVPSLDTAEKLKNAIGKTFTFSYNIYKKGPSRSKYGETAWQKNRFGVYATLVYDDQITWAFLDYLDNYSTDNGEVRVVMKWTVPDLNFTEGMTITIATDPNYGYAYPDEYNSEIWYIKDIKLEEGEKATPWCPNKEDSSYNNSESDTSGYYHTLSRFGNITHSTDTVRYIGSTKFDGNSYIYGSDIPKSSETLSLWAYIGSSLPTLSVIFADYNSGLAIGFNSNPIINGIIVSAGSDDYSQQPIYSATSVRLNNWNHFVVVKNGSIYKLYINNLPISNLSSTDYWTQAENLISIGGRSVSSIMFDRPFNGSISDVRLYATALSEKDIKELYETSAIIDDKGNLFAYDFIENDSVSIGKNGIVTAKSFENADKVQIYDNGTVKAKQFIKI